MTECVIVAIPRQDDYVFEMSSEKIPHMTLLYLGELSSEDQQQKILEFVEHASSNLKPFGMEVSRRGLLGDDKADVLYFIKDPENPIYQYRSNLLSNDTIRSEYDTAYQYPEWTPHLTLGYPETPANKHDGDYREGWVDFDRIAVWFGEFEGSEFILNTENMEVMTHQQMQEDFLAHYGVMGMKWHVRRGQGAKAFTKAVNKSEKIDKRSSKLSVKGAKLQYKGARRANLRKMAKGMKMSYAGERLKQKGVQWRAKMAKHLFTVKVSDLTPEQQLKGRNFLSILDQD